MCFSPYLGLAHNLLMQFSSLGSSKREISETDFLYILTTQNDDPRSKNGVLEARKFEIANVKLHNANCWSFGQNCGGPYSPPGYGPPGYMVPHVIVPQVQRGPPGDNFDRDNFDRGKILPPLGFLRLVVLSWWALDGSCYFLVGSGWFLVFPGGLWMVPVISWWALDGSC